MPTLKWALALAAAWASKRSRTEASTFRLMVPPTLKTVGASPGLSGEPTPMNMPCSRSAGSWLWANSARPEAS